MKSRVYIASPGSEQGIALTRLLRQHPDFTLTGALPTNEGPARSRLRCVPISEAMSDEDAIIIPTGIKSTTELLDLGLTKIGTVGFQPSILRATDKVAMLNRARRLNIPIPQTWLSVKEIPSHQDRVFFKESMEVGGGRRGLMRTTELDSTGAGLIFQEFIDSPGTFGVAFLASEGVITVQHTHHELSSAPRDGGSAITIAEFRDLRLTRYTEQLVRDMRYTGWGLAEFKWCPLRKDFVFMEINSKLWASCEFTFRSEPRFLDSIFGRRVDVMPTRSRMVFVHRLLAMGVAHPWGPLSQARGSTLVIYPGGMRAFLSGCTPMKTRHAVARLRSRWGQ